MMFNAAKAYVGHLRKDKDYKLLQPVYSLNLVNDIFEKNIPEWYHHYRLVHNRYNNKVIEGLQLILVELPNFTPKTITEKKTAVLWLRFLTEIDEQTREVPQELLDNEDVKDAIDIVEESAYTDEEMLAYDDFWDAVRVEKALANEAETRRELGCKEGHKEGLKKGHKEGLEEGLKEGHKEGVIKVTRNMLAKGMEVDVIAQLTGLSKEDINSLN